MNKNTMTLAEILETFTLEATQAVINSDGILSLEEVEALDKVGDYFHRLATVGNIKRDFQAIKKSMGSLNKK